MTYALFVNDASVQLFDADPDLHPSLDVRDVSGVKGFALGWVAKSDGGYGPPPEPEFVPSPAPFGVSSAQAKIALKRAGYLPAVKAAVDALGAEDEAAIWFSDARTWERGNNYVARLGEAVGLDSDAIDDLFRQAAQIAA